MVLVASQLLGYHLAFSGQTKNAGKKAKVLSAAQAQRLIGKQSGGGGIAAPTNAVVILHFKAPQQEDGTRRVDVTLDARAAPTLVKYLQSLCVFNKLSGLRLSRSSVQGFSGVELTVGTPPGGAPPPGRLDAGVSAGDVLSGSGGRIIISTGSSMGMAPSQGWQVVGRVLDGLDTLQQHVAEYGSVEIQDCSEP
eukprot:CAMPEP_0177789732 /NCGR_PEP_ID=MMETSP0491_2-20121128/22934_1 /TAXON_ID=63592 /ORGANISM="Tetraselmis chuii, Strain PLY429" /LENGTH=193 /DNA_ID=CAMNT_0019311671 /DNA_START=1177 /DNA_END=1758 /DNA_ORIENTATION=+